MAVFQRRRGISTSRRLAVVKKQAPASRKTSSTIGTLTTFRSPLTHSRSGCAVGTGLCTRALLDDQAPLQRAAMLYVAAGIGAADENTLLAMSWLNTAASWCHPSCCVWCSIFSQWCWQDGAKWCLQQRAVTT